MKFGPLPLFKIIGHFCASKDYIQGRLTESADAWDAYVDNENEEHKKTYIKTEGQGFLD